MSVDLKLHLLDLIISSKGRKGEWKHYKGNSVQFGQVFHVEQRYVNEQPHTLLTVMIVSFRTDRLEQTVQTKIRLLLDPRGAV